MSKQRKSKLDQYAAHLLQMDDEKQTLDQMLAWLKDEGCVVARSTLAEFLESERQSRLQARLLSQISTGARQCAEVEKQFGKNPAPELETLIKLQRVILLQLSTQANANPEFLELIGNSFKAVLDSEKLKLRREEFSLARNRFEFDAAKACLEKLPELKLISERRLSDEEKAKAIQQILFLK